MEPKEYKVHDSFIVEVVDVDSPNYITLISLPVFISPSGEKNIKIGEYYFDAYQLQRIVNKLKGE